MRLIIRISLVVLFVSNSCAHETKNESTLDIDQSIQDKPIHDSRETNSLQPESTTMCPDSAISYENYSKYWSKDLEIENNFLTEFKVTGEKLINTLTQAIEIQNKISSLEIYELFTRKTDNVDILIRKGIAKHVKGESPYDIEYYIFRGDTLLGDSQSPTFYYYDDSLKAIETYSYDKVEGCSFSKSTKYFKNEKISLIREYHFYLNCWTITKEDSLNGFIRDGNFRETLSFIRNNVKDNYNRELNFYQCKESSQFAKYIIEKIYSTQSHQEILKENTNLAKYD